MLVISKMARLQFGIVLLAAICIIACEKNTSPDGAAISGVIISAIQPTHGGGETNDTIIGAGFDKIPTLDSIYLNGKKLTLISRTATQIVVKIPSFAGTGNIEIWYEGKVVRSPVFTYDKRLMMTTLAGGVEQGASDGQGLNARFNYLMGIAVDQTGNVYVSDNRNSAIRKITALGVVSTLAGTLNGELNYVDGTGAAARFASPWGLAIDTEGNLYVGDELNHRIRKVSPTGVVTTFAGAMWDGIPAHGANDGISTVATFNTPRGVAVDKTGNVYVADVYNNKIRKITPQGVVSSFAGGGYYQSGNKDGPISTALFAGPQVVTADLFGNIFVIDNDSHLFRKITPGGIVSTILGPIEETISGPDDLLISNAMATDKDGNLFFATREGIFELTVNNKILRYAVGGVGENDGPFPFASFRAINGIAIDDLGILYIADNNRVRKIGWQ
jgi:sugar lactone lactonase YvrE